MLSDFLLGLAGARGEYTTVDGQVRHRTRRNPADFPACPLEAEAQKLGHGVLDIFAARDALGLSAREAGVVIDAADNHRDWPGFDPAVRALLLSLCEARAREPALP